MCKYRDLTGQKFGRLLVIGNRQFKNSRVTWDCICDCGTFRTVRDESLINGITVSCGCYQKERSRQAITTHGKSKTRLFSIWQNVKRRCYNPNFKHFHYYGGRGISMCDEWRNDFNSFYKWSTSNGYDSHLTLDRINSNGNYEPNNCRWLTRKEQSNNTRRNHVFTINNESKTIAQWCELYNVPYERVRQRVMNYDWNILDALTTPPLKRNHQPR